MHPLARRSLACAAIAACTAVAPAAARPVFQPSATRPEGLALSPGDLTLRVDAGAVAELRAREAARLEVPLTGGRRVSLLLERAEGFAPGATVTATGERGARRVVPDVTLYRGAVEGVPESWAVVTFSRTRVQGVFEMNGVRYGLSPLRERGGETPLHVVGESNGPAHPDFRCDVEALGPPEPPRRERRPGLESGGGGLHTATRRWCELAVDCDFEFYAVRQDSNLSASIQYVTTLVGVVSAIYEADVDVAIRISHLNVWTTAADPYTATTTSAELTEFQTFWNNYRGDVPRHLAHLLSGRHLGGGIAYLSALCNRTNAYGVSQVDGYYSYPTSATTWDAYVLAHELGHNFSSSHTHSCVWQSGGLAPPGSTLDSCYTPEGGCHTGPYRVPSDRGTIMSYCHLRGPLNSTIRLQFHDVCRQVMRNHAEDCLPTGAFDPAIDLAGAVDGSTVRLSWDPSPTPGVIRYDVYRSGTTLDPAPQLAGSTTDTTYEDPGRVGTLYYRVRAVRAGDESAYSNEVRLEACTQATATFYPSGVASLSPVAYDANRDGILDVVVANHAGAGGGISLLLGQGTGGVGDGTFAAPIADTAGTRPSAIAVADFDEDGILDLAVANDAAAGTFSVLLGGTAVTPGDPYGTPVSYPTGSNPVAIISRDWNEDGVADLAVANSAGSSVTIALGIPTAPYSGVGSGAFAAPVNVLVGSGPSGLAAADFDEDGILDLAVSKSTGAVSLLFGNGSGGRGDGSFTLGASYATGSAAAGVVTGDFDEDGIADLAVPRNVNGGSVAVLLGRGSAGVGDGTFWTRVEYPAGNFVSSIVTGDFNSDGVADLVVANSENPGTAAVLFGGGTGVVGDGTFDAPVFHPMGGIPAGVTGADFDEDGALDLAVSHSAHAQNLAVRLAGCAGALGGSIEVITPDGGEWWPVTTEQTVAWTRGPSVVAVNVEVSRDEGATWETIAEAVTDTFFRWTVTDPSTDPMQARVRVRDVGVPTRADTSDSAFTIGPNPLTDATPAPGGGTLALSRVFPNPARGRLLVSFRLPETGAAALELVDVAGRRRARREVGSLGPGVHVVDLARGTTLESGIYFVRLLHGGRVLTARTAVLR